MQPRLDFRNYRSTFPFWESGKTHVDEDDTLKQGIIDNLGRKLNCQIDSIGQKREMTCINESGLYSLMLINKFSLAKEFKNWQYVRYIAINYYLGILIAPLFSLLRLDSIRVKIMVEIV